MNVLNVNKFYYMRGGAERYYFALAKMLESNGHDVIPFSMQDERNFPSSFSKYFVSNLELGKPGLKMARQIGRTFWSGEARKKLSRLLEDVSVDVAHLHLIYHHMSPSILPLLKERGIPTVMTLHDYKIICPNYLLYTEGLPCERCKGHRYYNAVVHKCLKQSAAVSAVAAAEVSFHKLIGAYEKNIDVLIAPSQFVKNEFVKFGQHANRIVVIPHFVDPAFLQPVKTADPDKPYMLYFGRLSAEKGIDKLLETLYIYKPKLPLKIAGTGPLLPWIESYIKERGLASQVQLLGHLQTEELRGYIANASLTVVPSRVYETFGFSALESIALGTPVVAFAMGGLSEIVTPEVGRLVKLDDRAGLAAAIDEVGGWQKSKIADACRQLVQDKYTPDRHMDALQTVYSHLRKQ